MTCYVGGDYGGESKRRQTETATNRNSDKLKRRQTITATNRNGDSQNGDRAETATNHNGDIHFKQAKTATEPERRQTVTATFIFFSFFVRSGGTAELEKIYSHKTYGQ